MLRMIDDSRADVDERTVVAVFTKCLPQVFPCAALVFAAERTVIHSDVPVLFVSGTLDGRTPPSNAQEVLSGFPNGVHVLIEGSGHGHDLFVGSPEIKRLMVEFIKAGRVTTNRIVLPPLQFRRSKW